MQNEIISNDYEILTKKISPYQIQVNDLLQITVTSPDPKTNSFFNPQNNMGVVKNNVEYSIDDSGCIYFPFVGLLKIKDLTINDATSLIQSSLNKYFKQTFVTVNLTGYNITILGDVNKPGTYLIKKEQINIFELLGLAGDITILGNKRKIILIRKEIDSYKIKYLDLTQMDILQSEDIFLKPNDLIYIEPLRAKSFGYITFPFSTILQAITTLALLITVLQ